jgi:outer membrane protein insertion porin family
MSRVAISILCISLLVPSVAATQSKGTSTQTPARTRSAPDAGNKLVSLKVKGTTRYTDAEILAASGLSIGQPAADGDFKEATQRLGNSGMFGEVVYSFTFSGAGVKLELQVSDTDKNKLVPATFENFVWFTDDQLLAAVQPRVPLFKKLLPLGGNLSDRVEEALQATLTDKHLPGRVDFLREGDPAGGPLHAIDYRVEEVSIQIHGFEFPGASREQSALLTTAAHRAIGASYDRTRIDAVAKFDLLPVYLQRGYLKATFGTSDAKVLSEPPAASGSQPSDEVQVDAIVPVTPGKMYSTSSLDWKGNSAISTSELAPLVHLPVGQPADAVRLVADIATLEKLYRSRGYMAIQVKPDTQFDEEKSTVHYALNIVEGGLYKMGELDILGLDTDSTARMRAAWTLKTGQPFNDDYLKQFLEHTRNLLPRGVQWGLTTHVTPDAKDKTVDVEIHFKQE